MLRGWLARLALLVLQAVLGLLFFTLKAMGVEGADPHGGGGRLIGSDLCFEKKHHPDASEDGWIRRRRQ